MSTEQMLRGPWKLGHVYPYGTEQPNRARRAVVCGGWIVAEIPQAGFPGEEVTPRERDDLAALVAAAPAMRAALLEILGDLGGRPGIMHLPSIHAARAAIAQARGK